MDAFRRVRGGVRSLAKRSAHVLLGDYQASRVYRLELDAYRPGPLVGQDLRPLKSVQELASSSDENLRRMANGGGDGATAYGLWWNQKLVSALWIWRQARIDRPYVVPITAEQAVVGGLATHADFRGRGFARLLLRYAADQAAQDGLRCLYASVWHSDHAAIATFASAGWHHIADAREVFPFGTGALRWTRNRSSPH